MYKESLMFGNNYGRNRIIKRTEKMIRTISAVFLLISFWQLANAQSSQQLPAGTREQYVSYVDASISDEFNASKLDLNKWGRRATGGYMVSDFLNDSSLVVMKSQMLQDGEKVNYLSIKGIGEDGPIRTAGIVSKATGYYGFYVVRFRYEGFDNPLTKQEGTIWHPSVWGAETNHAARLKRNIGKQDFWVEIDFMEWEGRCWSSDAPARLVDSKGKKRKVITKGEGIEKCVMRKEVQKFDNEWQTIGLEYSPEYFKLWEWKNGKWQPMGDRVVRFVEDDAEVPESKYTLATMGKKARTPVFWLIGNVVSRYLYPKIEDGSTQKAKNNMNVDFDFFRYYRHVDAVKMDWPWENQLPNGGGEIQ